jgi:hypothetical protein
MFSYFKKRIAYCNTCDVSIGYTFPYQKKILTVNDDCMVVDENDVRCGNCLHPINAWHYKEPLYSANFIMVRKFLFFKVKRYELVGMKNVYVFR